MSRSTSTSRRHKPKAERHIATCVETGKYCHRSRKRALGALNHALAHPLGATSPVAVYRCPFCREWHLTSQPQREAG